MIIRPAYPDELGRAKSLLNGHPVPSHASFLVAVKEQPVERLIATIPWWKVARSPQLQDSTEVDIRYHLASSGAVAWSSESLNDIQTQLEAIAKEEDASAIYTDFSLPEDHPLYQRLIQQGYEVCQTDRHFSVPGETVKSRSLRIYKRLKNRLPDQWRVESIRGHDPQPIYALIAENQLMTPQQFQSYWKSDRGEHFEGDYSFIVFDGEKMIALFLVSRRGQDELHTHVECVHPDHMLHSALLSATLRNASFSQCPEGFPKVFTCRADSEKHQQTGNSALRNGGTEAPPRLFLRKPTHS
ncbi:MAG: hypothetical protein ACSHX6_14925 [Akkermansiaceae bacterium]